MLKNVLIGLGILVVLFTIATAFIVKNNIPKLDIPDTFESSDLQAIVEKVVADNSLPGMAVATLGASGVERMAVAGHRKIGGTEKITPKDQFHLGSNTKAMTSALVAMYIDDGLIDWETTIMDVFPEWKEDIHTDYHTATIYQLLTHTAGINANASNWWAYADQGIIEIRLSILKDNLKEAMSNTKGTYLYSNLGYMIAGSILEKITGKSWESLMQERIFDTLDMKSAGFGIPGTLGKEDQPWGHTKSVFASKYGPIQQDNAEALGPAGTVYCNLEDYGKFLDFQFFDKDTTLLSLPQREQLLTVAQDDYACGWSATERSWANGLAYTHAGSNTMNFALTWVAPQNQKAYVVCTNSASSNTFQLCDGMIGALIQLDSKE